MTREQYDFLGRFELRDDGREHYIWKRAATDAHPLSQIVAIQVDYFWRTPRELVHAGGWCAPILDDAPYDWSDGLGLVDEGPNNDNRLEGSAL